jgi:RNA polymerase sigma factor (sigma-70 family)
VTRRGSVDRDDRVADLLRATAPALHATLTRRLGADAAEDALSEVMVAAWRRASSLPDGAEEARMWLFGIARNIASNAERGARRRDRLVAKTVDSAAPAVRSSDAADSGLEVRDAIARLDPPLAELVRVVHWDGLSLAEAAALLGIPASTARSRYAKAKRELRTALAVEEDDGGADPIPTITISIVPAT